MNDATNTEMIRLSDALATANARVAELERERDQLALSLSATRAERDHAARSAELLESEYRTCYAAMEDYKHAWLEGRAIMAVSMYFGRMRGPDAWITSDDDGYIRFHTEMPEWLLQQFPTAVPLYAGYAGSTPVPAAQADDARSALAVLSRAMQRDADFAWAWHCNIAMTARDAGAPHDRANIWAANFMRRAFDVDTLTHVNTILSAAGNEECKDGT